MFVVLPILLSLGLLTACGFSPTGAISAGEAVNVPQGAPAVYLVDQGGQLVAVRWPAEPTASNDLASAIRWLFSDLSSPIDLANSLPPGSANKLPTLDSADRAQIRVAGNQVIIPKTIAPLSDVAAAQIACTFESFAAVEKIPASQNTKLMIVSNGTDPVEASCRS